MAESVVAVTEGAGKKLHTNSRTIGANTVEDEYILNGEPFLATYSTVPGAISIATANDHILTINAGASLHVYIRRMEVYQVALATTAAMASFNLLRTTTAAPTGGTAQNQLPFDSTDSAAGATSMTLPTVKATEGNIMWRGSYMMTQTVATAGGSAKMFEVNFDQLRTKGLRIPAGTTNGMAFKSLTAIAAATIFVNIWYSEANF